MTWVKKGLLFSINGDSDWANSHCHKPTPLLIDYNTLRVYFGVRDIKNITRTTFIDLDITDVENIKVKYIHDKPVLDIGKIGAFDDSGANVSSVILVDDIVYMYYIGWNPSTTVHTRNAIGVVVSDDGGTTFNRLYDGSVLDRSKDEPYYTGAVDVVKEKDNWRMYYTSGLKWEIIKGKPEIIYYIKLAESKNGIDWTRNNIDCIVPRHQREVTARPSIIFENGVYKMWYSYRSIDGFRNDPSKGYRGGYAESEDGINWVRKDELFGVSISETGWDSEAIAYPYVIKVRDAKIMLYNGNRFGETGFGYAIYK